MNRSYTRIVWENSPSINTPLNAANLNKMDKAVYDIDGNVVNLDATKAAQTDLLAALKNVTYNTSNGKFVFTWFNGTTKEVDLNVEKIPVNFSMSTAGVITMKTADGSEFTADVASLIKTYTFTDTADIDFTVTVDQSGNKTVTAVVKEGSITESKLQPNFLADCRNAKSAAENAATEAETDALIAEGYAIGKQNGEAVTEGQYFENNAKYYKDAAKDYKDQAQTLATYAKNASVIGDFSLDSNGNLVYEDNSVHEFTVGADGNLYYEVKGATV